MRRVIKGKCVNKELGIYSGFIIVKEKVMNYKHYMTLKEFNYIKKYLLVGMPVLAIAKLFSRCQVTIQNVKKSEDWFDYKKFNK